MSSCDFLVNCLRNLLRHAWCSCLQEARGNVAGEDGYTQGIHCLETGVHFCKLPLPSNPKCSELDLEQLKKQGGSKEWCSFSGRSPLSGSHCKLQRCLAEKRWPSVMRDAPLQHLHIASAQPEAPLFHWRKKPPQVMMVPPSTVPWRNRVVPVMLEAIRTVKVSFFLIRE